ncbi:MAG: prepilin-type N-terminal cleavage/methylation domain-containing protein [Burkholderiaceae bacterium]|nr:prepilin-type N-terminal cleavage/methylation domain-containing protein [Burkholderiaceae bacterium]
MKQVTSPAGSGREHFTRRGRGFTTIELLITIVILGILLAVALPSYQSSMRKSRRAEAFAALSNVQQAQERHRSTNATFTTLITAATTATPPGLGLPATRTPNGYYDLAIGSADATTYVATATAVTGTSQANDGDCAVLAVRVAGGNIRYGAGASIDWTAANTDPQRCWAR